MSYIEGLRIKMREAAGMADKADRDWNELNQSFNVRQKAINRQRKAAGRPLMTEQEKRDEKSVNFELSDAFAMQSWWRTQTMYYASLLQAELAADQLLRLGRR